jgi:multiple sugar transport system substrate-binding protein
VKRLVGIVLIIAVAGGGLLFAAGGSQSSGGKKISFYYWDQNQKSAMDEVVQAYQKSSGVQVESTIIPYSQYWTKLQTSLPSENGPDVFWINMTYAVDYFPAGLAENLTPYIQRDKVDLSPFPKALIEMYTYNGNLYGLPKDYDTIGLYYNKGLFDAKGVAYPTDNWTWDDLRKAAVALTDPAAGVWGFVSGFSGQENIYPWVVTNNGPLVTPDRRLMKMNTPETIEAIQFLFDLINVYKVSPTGASQKEVSAGDLFQAGKAAMVATGSWAVPPLYDAFGDRLGVVRIPINKRPGNVIHGLSFVMSAKSQNKEAAWGLIKAFSTKEAGEAQAKVTIPAYEGAAESWKNNYPNLNLQCFITAAGYADMYPGTTVAGSAQEDIADSSFERLWINGGSVQAAMEALDRDCAAAAAAAK